MTGLVLLQVDRYAAEATTILSLYVLGQTFSSAWRPLIARGCQPLIKMATDITSIGDKSPVLSLSKYGAKIVSISICLSAPSG